MTNRTQPSDRTTAIGFKLLAKSLLRSTTGVLSGVPCLQLADGCIRAAAKRALYCKLNSRTSRNVKRYGGGIEVPTPNGIAAGNPVPSGSTAGAWVSRCQLLCHGATGRPNSWSVWILSERADGPIPIPGARSEFLWRVFGFNPAPLQFVNPPLTQRRWEFSDTPGAELAATDYQASDSRTACRWSRIAHGRWCESRCVFACHPDWETTSRSTSFFDLARSHEMTSAAPSLI